ncbi:MAG TPA: prepilin-type N-terminal cleavage/methylation domain-containing protein [Candidatus Acidoferrum sp.]|jgi:type II secretory pathway pseudopilin PulG|nr:prepilin-type N-terminal cleavage/methylation domain-containing protein [Candidatus Acidoferrum sp.]
MTSTKRRNKHQSGFTLLEALIAIVILSFGILSLAAVYAQGIQVAAMTQMDYIAEKKTEEAVETIFAARDSKILAWTNIRNVTGLGGANDGVFLPGAQPLLAAGPDGLYGTVDDVVTSPMTVITGPGPDGILGTADDVVMSLQGMTRTIAIVDVPGESGLRQITITMNYTVGSLKRQYTLISYIAQFS